MRLLPVQQSISDLMATFATQVKASVAGGLLDKNRVAETVLVPLLAEVFDCPDLENLNDTEGLNFPSADLGDTEARVAFQVTSTPTSAKVQDALTKFVRHGLHERFDRLYVYVLSEKQGSYSARPFQRIVDGKLDFDPDRDILDYRDIVRTACALQVDRARRVLEILEANFAGGAAPFTLPRRERTERLYTNLLEVRFPDILYVAETDVERKEVIERSRENGRYLRYDASERDVVYAAMRSKGLKFSADWEVSGGRVLTFHDITDDLPLSRVVDQGTIEAISPDEFYGAGEDAERVFKSLLRRCLQQMLYKRGVQWQHKEGLFIFTEEDKDPLRKETWTGKQKASREVYRRTMKTNKPDEVLKCRHLAFEAGFVRLGDDWYVRVTPEWFFSIDGYRRSPFEADSVDWLKRRERNEHVFNHLRFIAYYLKHGRPSTLFSPQRPYPFLSFGHLLGADGAPHLDDGFWLMAEDDNAKRKLEDEEGAPPLTLDL